VNPVLLDFLVQTLSGIVAVFLGVWLALITDRRRMARQEAARELERTQHGIRARHTVLGSVAKNTAEAKRLRSRLDRRKPCELIHTEFEVSVWDAVQAQFMQSCYSVDERVRFAQFFDGVRSLQRYFEFHRQLQLSIAVAVDAQDPELAAVQLDADQRLRELSDDLRFNGVLLITDYGDPLHRKLVGLKTAEQAAA
jgi:hypothetical protein